MTWKEARRCLKTLAQGKYYCMKYSLCEHSDRDEGQECWVYIEGTPWFVAKSWEKALEKITEHLFPPTTPIQGEPKHDVH